MRRGAILIAAIAVLPMAAGAQQERICRFETLCSDTTPCEAAEPDSTIFIRGSGEIAEITIEDKTVIASRATTMAEDPETYFASEPDTGGALMVSVYADGTGIASLHGDLFGPFAVTLFGTCSAAGE
jgi:hypothetical protein